MTDQNVSEIQQDETTASQDVDYKSLAEKLQADLEKVVAHKDKLYAEMKKAKQDRDAADMEARQIAEQKALKDGEFEKLWKTAKEEKDMLMKQLNDFKQSNRREKIQVNAMRIATELADGDNAELLSEFIMKNLDRMADDSGSLSDDVIASVRDEYKHNGKFKALLRGSKATGGSANGNLRSAPDTNEMTRDAFDKLRADKRMAFIKSGGVVVDN